MLRYQIETRRLWVFFNYECQNVNAEILGAVKLSTTQQQQTFWVTCRKLLRILDRWLEIARAVSVHDAHHRSR
jgi:hypothetical protein